MSLTRGFDGWWTLHGTLEPDAGAALRLVLDDLAAPVATLDADGATVPDPRTRHQRQHDALTDLAALYTQTALEHAHHGDGDNCSTAPAVQVDGVDAVNDQDAEPPATAAKGPCRTWPRPSTTLHLLIDADRVAGLIPGLTDTSPPRLREQPGTVARTLDGTPIPGPAAEHLTCDPSLTWTLTRRPEEPLPPPRPPGDLWLPPPAPRPWAGTTAGAPPREPNATAPLAGGLVLPTRYDLSDETLTTAILASLDTIAPALGGTGTVILDAGRTRRLGSPAQRTNSAIRDRGCVVHGCTVPAWLCELHHLIEWILGGTTDLDTMALLCRSHHRFLHRHSWTLTPLPRTSRYLLLPPGHSTTAAA